jgi:outer membrane murein-binding lipoprotein Lpp
MKKFLLFTALIATVFASCISNKAKVDPLKPAAADTISATIDGVNESFNSLDTTRYNSPNSLYLSGANADNADKMILILGSTGSSIDTGTYVSTYPAAKGLEILYGVGPGYTPDNLYYTYDIIDGASFDAIVKVTSVTSSNIKGTFSGTVVLESSVLTASPVTKAITNGKFNLAIKQSSH